MDAYPETFAFVQIHYADSYVTTWGEARADFYELDTCPTSWFDGVLEREDAWTYAVYRADYLERRDVPTDVTIELSSLLVGPQTYEITANVCIEAGGTPKIMRIYMVQVLDHWPATPSYSRNGFKQAADEHGSEPAILVGSGTCQEITRTFTFDTESWLQQDDIKIIAWAQQPGPSGPAEVFQAAIMTWPFAADCNGNGILDECDIDCGLPGCDVPGCGESQDCNTNGIPDECDIASSISDDCQPNGIPDECDLAGGTSGDCNTNGIPDECDIAGGTSPDVNGNGVPDECEACVSDADCDDGVDCTDDACISGTCVSTPSDANCPSDGLFCTGPETCDAWLGCVSSGDPCLGTGLICDETNDDCRACLSDAECSDAVACTDDACLNGKCVSTPNDASCPDDGVFCNGTGVCAATSGCVSSGDPCVGSDLICDEVNDVCVACMTNAECDDGLFCNGAETCADGSCAGGDDPCPDQACDEDQRSCFEPECAADADCDDDDVCTTDVCAQQRCRNTAIPGCKDTDKDGVADDDDDCPNTSSGAEVDRRGCSCDQLDADADGVNNCDDECSDTPEGAEADADGCSCDQLDDDADEVDNCEDACAGTPADQAVDETGCADSQRDSDVDGVLDPEDRCPGTAAGEEVDAEGCSFAQRDDDEDEVLNARDLCPDTSPGMPVDADGCAHSQVDRDGDGVFDAFDQCLDTPVGERVDAQGCSAGQRRSADLEVGALAPGAGAGSGSGAGGGAGSCGLLGVIPPAFTCLGLTALRNLGRRRR